VLHIEGRFVSQATGNADFQHSVMTSLFGAGALRFRLNLDGKTHTLITNDGLVSSDRWMHTVFGYDGATMSIHIDGQLVASQNISGEIANTPDIAIAIGNQPSGAGSRVFVGQIDELAIFNRSLSPEEIALLALLPEEVCQPTRELIETPIVETPIVETPIVETPVVETPIVETPVVEAPDAPAVPVDFLAEMVSATSLTLAWADAQVGSSDEVPLRYQLIGSDGPAVRVEDTRYTVEGLKPGTTYNWELIAVDRISGRRSAAAVLSVTTLESPVEEAPELPVPADLRAIAATPTSVTLGWTLASGDQAVDGFKVERDGNEIISLTDALQILDDELASERQYQYRVAAVGSDGSVGEFSAAFTTRTSDAPDPVIPAGEADPFRTASLVFGLSATSAQWGDFDRDGDKDLFVSNGGIYHDNGPVLAWFEAPSWTRHDIATPLEPFTGDSQVADFDGDGDLDVAVATDTLSRALPLNHGAVYWFENPGRGSGNWPRHTVERNVPNARHIGELRAGDIDRDGRIDLVGRHLGTHRIVIWFNNSDDSWTPRRIPVRPREGLQLADVDADGRLDIIGNGFLLYAPANARNGDWITREIDSAFSSQARQGLNNTSKAALFDLDGDGRKDLVFSGAEGDPIYMAWYKAPVDRRNGNWSRNIIERGLNSHQVLIADFDLDGDPDLFGGDSWNESGVYWWENVNGNASRFVRHELFNDRGCYNCVIADVDGDGDVDVAGPSTFHEEVWFYENRTID